MIEHIVAREPEGRVLRSWDFDLKLVRTTLARELEREPCFSGDLVLWARML